MLLLSAAGYAQDTAMVRRQADAVAKAVVNGNYKLITNSMYPKMVQQMGGRDKVLQQTTAVFTQMLASGLTIANAVAGPPGKFYRAGNEIHCLVPETISLKTPNGIASIRSNLLAVSKDGGKRWTFLDLNKNTIAAIPQMFPRFNKALKIPEPRQSFFQ